MHWNSMTFPQRSDTVKRSFLLSGLALAIPLFAFAQPAPAPSPPEIEVIPQPESAKALEFKGEVGVPLTLSLKGGEKTRWKLIDSAAAAIVPCESGKRCTFVARAEGKYRLTAIAGEKDIDVVVIVGTPAPPPVPVPPTPPVPVDPLVARLQSLYTADTGTGKAEQLADLVELYAQAVKLAADPAVPTAAALAEQVKAASARLGILGLAEVRKAISAEVAASLPADRTAPLTADAREKMAATFGRVVNALKAVK